MDPGPLISIGRFTPQLAQVSFGVGLFVPKPTTDADCQRPSTRGLRQTVRGLPLASTVVRGDCHSLCHSAVREPGIASRYYVSAGLDITPYKQRQSNWGPE